MFIGLEAIDEDGLKRFRKRINLDRNMEALEAARSLGINVAINLIADPSWDRDRFETVRQWCGNPRTGEYQRDDAVSGHGNLAN